MGSKGNDPTIGFKYLRGEHSVLCEGPIDALLALEFGEREAWRGFAIDQRITVSAPDLFGGEAREGGVSGRIDVLGGGPDQGVNDYLSQQLDGLVPAFRRVVSLVFRQFYFGNNPYPKPWRAQVQSVYQTFGSWLPQYAAVNAETRIDNTAIYMALDNSGSMLTGTRLQTQRDAAIEFINTLPVGANLKLKLVAFGDTEPPTLEWLTWNEQARTEAITFVTEINGSSGFTRFDSAVALAPDYFDRADAVGVTSEYLRAFRPALPINFVVASGEATTIDPVDRLVILVTDGLPTEGTIDGAVATLAGIENVRVAGFNIELSDTSGTEQISDFPVPVILDTESNALTSLMLTRASGICDLNAAHIIRDVLIHPRYKGSGNAADIGDSFAAAAELFAAEGLGLTFFWENPSDRDGFLDLVLRHVDAKVYEDSLTGKFEIKPVRPDYEFADLFTYDDLNILDWIEYPERPMASELVNQVQLVYTDRRNGEPLSVTLSNSAAVLAAGGIRNEKVEMEGITWGPLANRICARELTARSTPLYRGAFRAAYLRPGLNLGSVFNLNDPELGLANTACRILEIGESDGVDNSVIIRFVEDVFFADAQAPAFTDEDFVEPVAAVALVPEFQFAFELPYYEFVQISGEANAAALLADDPDLGVWGAGAVPPNAQHDMAAIARETGSTFVQVASTSLAASWVLSANLSRLPDVQEFSAAETGREGELAIGALLLVDEEFLRLDAISITDGVATFTVGRACLDTAPAFHAIGSRVVAWQDAYGTDFVEYTGGDLVTIKVLPSARQSILPLSSAIEQEVEFNSRAARPYPVGQLQIDSSYDPAGPLSGDVVLSWAHRDRLFQTTAIVDDHLAGNIGPEAGVSYVGVFRVYNFGSEFFGDDDFFAEQDFFVDHSSFVDSEFVIDPASGTSETVSVDGADFFNETEFFTADDFFAGGYSAISALGALGIRSVNSASPALDSWQVPFVEFVPLLGPIEFVGVAE
jgi:hypothetical protein